MFCKLMHKLCPITGVWSAMHTGLAVDRRTDRLSLWSADINPSDVLVHVVGVSRSRFLDLVQVLRDEVM